MAKILYRYYRDCEDQITIEIRELLLAIVVKVL